MEFAELKDAIEKADLVDGHAHNLVSLASSFPFIRSFSEAHGDALPFSNSSISFKRSVREISKLYGCGNSIQDVENYRRTSGWETITSRCFEAAGISTVIIDDGLQLDQKLELDSLKKYIPNVFRILRIERLAEEILDNEMIDKKSCSLDRFSETFSEKMNSVVREIVGLKSIAAYRSGLAINTHVTRKEAEEALGQIVKAGSPARIQNKNFIDYVFTSALQFAQRFDLPVQLHSGFGDNDLDLRLGNPLHLRDVLEDSRFSKCRFVLLHASYPFSKEASYLASVYHQVYLDFGLAVPKLSHSGMVSSVKALLELAPLDKVMYSSDGYAFAETFYLGAKKARQVVYEVLKDACVDGDLTCAEAVEAAKNILARNALKFYRVTCGREEAALKSTKRGKHVSGNALSLVRLLWVDTCGLTRCRVVPVKRFEDVVVENGVGLTCACMALSSLADAPAPGTNLTATGEIRLVPDLSTRKRIPWEQHDEFVMADMHVEIGVEWEYCPRSILRKMINLLKDEFHLELNAGFENEFVVFKPSTSDGQFTPIDCTPYSSSAGFDSASALLHEMVDALTSLGIRVEQLHKEAGNGQFEIVLAHSDCLSAADNVVYAREAVRAIARKRELLASFLPKHSDLDAGSGGHVHISLWKDGENVFMASNEESPYGMSSTGEEFMAGVLAHLPALLAFTAPIPNSYKRMAPHMWSGAFQCWGRENREAALRTACPPGIGHGFVSNFEVKCFDAAANPYLGLAAIIAAGVDGLRSRLRLPEPVHVDPALLKDRVPRLPQNLGQSVEALENDKIFDEIMGESVVNVVKGVRKDERASRSTHRLIQLY